MSDLKKYWPSQITISKYNFYIIKFTLTERTSDLEKVPSVSDEILQVWPNETSKKRLKKQPTSIVNFTLAEGTSDTEKKKMKKKWSN